jgi:tyrosine-specific transport protein
MKLYFSKILGGILLVSGTTIGAGMLALPVVTGLTGFIPTISLFILYWFYMTFTAFLLLEVNLWFDKNSNIVTMAKNTLGKVGEITAWITYLFLLYLLTTAYLAVAGPILCDFIYFISGFEPPSWSGFIPILFFFSVFIYKGTRYVDSINRFMMTGLAIAFIIIGIYLTQHVKSENLLYMNWKYSLSAVSLIATSFGFHIIIPTLTSYMHRNVAEIKIVILIGSIIPLVIYILWETMTLGVIPLEGDNGIIYGYIKGINGIKLLSNLIESPRIVILSQFFSFFAIITSFLGVGLSLLDFLADGLKIKKNRNGKFILLLLSFVPPIIFVISYPRAFLLALDLAGAFGVIILLGLLPPLMVWSGRYYKGIKANFTVYGGKFALSSAIIVSIFVIFIELANKTGLSNLVATPE